MALRREMHGRGCRLVAVAGAAMEWRRPPQLPASSHEQAQRRGGERSDTCFRVPLHYPRYSKADYEKMPEWQIDCLLADYGLPVNVGDVGQKRRFAMGAFLWIVQ